MKSKKQLEEDVSMLVTMIMSRDFKIREDFKTDKEWFSACEKMSNKFNKKTIELVSNYIESERERIKKILIDKALIFCESDKECNCSDRVKDIIDSF